MTIQTSLAAFALALVPALSYGIGDARAQDCQKGPHATRAVHHQRAPANTADNRPGNRDILATAQAAGGFETLRAAIDAAGLTETLRGDGPFTVFAPTDAAFAKLPQATVNSLLQPQNRAMLVALLRYHVVPGRLDAIAVSRSGGLTTANGQRLTIKQKQSQLRVDKARIVQADIGAQNGVIHVIDTVLMPSQRDLVDAANRDGRFQTLLAALDNDELDEVLRGPGPYTVFAPTDRAFERLGIAQVATLLRPERRADLVALLQNHVVSGRVYAQDAAAAGRAHTAAGTKLRFALDRGRLRVNGARLLDTDVDAQNGVIHVVDRVLVPES